MWRQLEPVCETMCQQAGAVRKPTYHDFKWAYSIFWCVTLCAMPPSLPHEQPPVCHLSLGPMLWLLLAHLHSDIMLLALHDCYLSTFCQTSQLQLGSLASASALPCCMPAAPSERVVAPCLDITTLPSSTTLSVGDLTLA